jgi:hypothetical protein
MYSDTVVNQLSSTFYKTLSFLETPEFQNIKGDLTSLTHLVTSLEQEVTGTLSAIPVHPYDQLKYQYFDVDYRFKSLDDLEEPEDLPRENCIEYIKNKNKELMSTTFHNLTCCDEEKCLTAFSFNSGGQVLPDHQKQKNYIEFLEIARNIPIDSINESNHLSIAKKLLGYYIKSV